MEKIFICDRKQLRFNERIIEISNEASNCHGRGNEHKVLEGFVVLHRAMSRCIKIGTKRERGGGETTTSLIDRRNKRASANNSNVPGVSCK